MIGNSPDCVGDTRFKKAEPGRDCVRNITRSVKKVIVHEDYNAGGDLVTNDIALIRLNEPVPLFDDSQEEGTRSTRQDPRVKCLICETVCYDAF